jgi:hypothetical protein
VSESSDPRSGAPSEPAAAPPAAAEPGEQLYPARAIGSPPSPPPSPVSPGQYPPPGVYAGQPTNGLAIASLVLGILWLGWVGSVLAVIFGHVALGQIARAGGAQGGRGLAIAGLVLGWIGVGAFVLVFLLPLIGLGLLGGASTI